MKEDLKVLYFVNDYKHHVVKNFYYFGVGLQNVCDCRVWNNPANIHDVIEKLNFTPDFIFSMIIKEVL
ncbi:hypothetical protein [Peribacillus asahii]|uniref:hypothetical protein n=1 Tax=Peribacillus asahii TaxID=228899 RepID=UPI0038023869